MKYILFAIVVMIIGVDANPLLIQMGESKPELNDLQVNGSKDKPLFVNHYDQRQNGSENFRLKIDGLVFVVAPAETLLLAGAALEPGSLSTLLTDGDKPAPKPDKDQSEKPKPDYQNLYSFKNSQEPSTHETHKSSMRISHLLAPFLSRFRHHEKKAATQ